MTSKPRERVLITGHSGRSAHLASFLGGRNAMPHDALVVLTSEPNSPDLEALKRDSELDRTRLSIHTVDANNLNDCLRVAREVIAGCDTKSAAIHVTGGRRILTMSLMLAAFQHGLRSYYWGAEGITWLPFPDVAIVERFTPTERHVLRRCEPRGPTPIASLTTGHHARDEVLTAIRHLRKQGFLLLPSTDTLELTPQGIYSRQTLIHQRDDGEQRTAPHTPRETQKRGARASIRRRGRGI